MLTTTKRIVKSGFINFWRNGVVSLASILVFTVTLFIVATLIMGNAVLDSTLEQLRDKVDVTVYFTIDAPEDDILSLRDRVSALQEVKSAEYLSREEVLALFLEEHADDAATLRGLDELDGENPLGAELNIKARDPEQYTNIVRFVEDSSAISQATGLSIIGKVNFTDNKTAIDRFIHLSNVAEQVGWYISILAIIIAILVVFNTIRLAIYTSREEISVMRLVGANNSYIRGPFIIEGVMYGITGALFSLAILYPLTRYISVNGNGNKFGADYFGINLFEYYITNFPFIFSILIVAGVILGIVSSALAVRRYLKI
tara:strand:- start:1300 stop:2244 length:945 start_codon:yes stop_codon:yes gene_type:complete